MTSLRNETGKIGNFVVSFSHIITDFDFDRSPPPPLAPLHLGIFFKKQDLIPVDRSN